MEFKCIGVYPISSKGYADQNLAESGSIFRQNRRSGDHQIFLSMKLTVILILLGSLTVFGKGYSQQITYAAKDESLQKIFNAIQRQAGYGVLIDHDLLIQSKKVTFNVREATIGEFLDYCFKGQPYKV